MKILLFFLVSYSNTMFSNQDHISQNIIKKLIILDFSTVDKDISKLDLETRIEFQTLKQLLFNSGQSRRKDSISISKLIKIHKTPKNKDIRLLNLAYYNLFYNKRGNTSYSIIYESYSNAKLTNNNNTLKLSLLVLLKYYSRENTLTKGSFEHFLEEYYSLSSNNSEKTWYLVYKNLFEGRSVKGNFEKYKVTGKQNLDFYNNNKNNLNFSLKSSLYENISAYYRVSKKNKDSVKFFSNEIIKLYDYPFLKENKFNAFLDLAQIAFEEKKIKLGVSYLNKAKKNIDIGDSLKSTMTYNLFKSSYYYSQKQMFDSAYFSLKKSFGLNKILDYEENSSKISELNTKLETKEKEKKIVELRNTNLKIEVKRVRNQNIAIGLGGSLFLGIIIGFLIYRNTKRKQRIAEQERKIEIQKTEKLLKEQELNAIDAMISGQETERQRLANDLHDNLGSTLATVKLHFDHLKKNRNNPKLENSEELYTKTNNLLDEAYQKVRNIAHEKNSGVMANQGLLPAIKTLAKKVSTGNNLQVEIQDYGLNERLDNTLEISIFRMVQELITNTIKHANANEIHISLTNHDSLLNIIVEDNGKGFDAKILPEKEGMGLKSIEKRIEHLEGTFEVDSTIGKGTHIIINIPI